MQGWATLRITSLHSFRSSALRIMCRKASPVHVMLSSKAVLGFSRDHSPDNVSWIGSFSRQKPSFLIMCHKDSIKITFCLPVSSPLISLVLIARQKSRTLFLRATSEPASLFHILVIHSVLSGKKVEGPSSLHLEVEKPTTFQLSQTCPFIASDWPLRPYKLPENTVASQCLHL